MNRELVALAVEIEERIEAMEPGPERDGLVAARDQEMLRLRAMLIGRSVLDERIGRLQQLLHAGSPAQRSGYQGYSMEFQTPAREAELAHTIARGLEQSNASIETELDELRRLRAALD